MTSLRGLDRLELFHKRTILRCDLNVPIKDGAITDDGRIRASLPTIRYLLEKGSSVVIIAHMGRPKGEPKPEFSLEPVANRLGHLLGTTVIFSKEIVGDSAASLVSTLQPGQILLLENIRYDARETSKDEKERMELATILATYGENYVSDGFGAVHRKHASVYDLPKLLPHAAGLLIQREVEVLQKLTINPERPYGVVLGGAKVSDKLAVIENLLPKVDLLAIGGGMVFTFLAAQGYGTGTSLLEADMVGKVKEIIADARARNVELLLPSDIVVAPEISADATPTVVNMDSIPADHMGLDIGPISAQLFAERIGRCRTVFWNGPMGVFEFPNFANGTKVVAEALTRVFGMSVVGGGDSAAAVRTLGFTDSQFGYISTGGGASLEYLEGKELPGLKALE